MKSKPERICEELRQRPADPSPPFRGEREGPSAERWEGEVGLGKSSGIPQLTPTLSAPRGGEGVINSSPLALQQHAVFGGEGEGDGGAFVEQVGRRAAYDQRAGRPIDDVLDE